MSDRQEPITKKPLVVRVNGRSASASEILSGALQDNCRAILVGKRTFGKALIQSVYELSDGSGMVLTHRKVHDASDAEYRSDRPRTKLLPNARGTNGSRHAA